MARTITSNDIAQGFWNNIAKNVGISDKDIYGTDFKNSWITK